MSQLSPQPSQQPVTSQIATLRRLRRLSYLLDSAIGIPGTRFRIGLDPIIDLLPIGGDFVGTAFSLYIVLEAARLGMPRSALLQMVSNILVDTVIGAVPVLGALVDAAWKANVKNIALMEEHLDVSQPEKQAKANWLFIALLLGGVLLVVVVIAAISVFILRWLLSAITG